MMMYLRALGGVLLLDCMLYYALRLLTGRKRRLAGSIALYALLIPVVVGTVGLLGVDIKQTFTDELQVYRALWDAFRLKGQEFIAALTRPEKTTSQALTIVAMLVVALANVGIAVRVIPDMFDESRFEWSLITDAEDFFVQCMTLYPAGALLAVIGWALMVAVDIVLCIGAYFLLHGVLPF